METKPENEPETDVPETDEAIPENAILIMEGVRVYPLKGAVINIGRKFENQIIIDDPRISRTHAQLRAIKGHFVLFDLGSTGGTFVNGQRTSQSVLYVGDVISLAGVTLIFSQDSLSPHPERIDTSPLGEPGSSQRPTPTMERSTMDVYRKVSKPSSKEDAATPDEPFDERP